MVRLSLSVLVLSTLLLSSSIGFVAPYNVLKPEEANEATPPSFDATDVICGVCQKVAGEIVEQIRRKESEKKVTEKEVNEIARGVCQQGKETGGWIRLLTLVKNKIVKKESDQGKCDSKCQTIHKACEQVMKDDKIPASVWKKHRPLKAEILAQDLCHDFHLCPYEPKVMLPTRSSPPNKVPSQYTPMTENVKIERKILSASLSLEGIPGKFEEEYSSEETKPSIQNEQSDHLHASEPNPELQALLGMNLSELVGHFVDPQLFSNTISSYLSSISQSIHHVEHFTSAINNLKQFSEELSGALEQREHYQQKLAECEQKMEEHQKSLSELEQRQLSLSRQLEELSFEKYSLWKKRRNLVKVQSSYADKIDLLGHRIEKLEKDLRATDDEVKKAEGDWKKAKNYRRLV